MSDRCATAARDSATKTRRVSTLKKFHHDAHFRARSTTRLKSKRADDRSITGSRETHVIPRCDPITSVRRLVGSTRFSIIEREAGESRRLSVPIQRTLTDMPRIALARSDNEPMEMPMSTNPSFAADRLAYRTRFVLVNDRVPRTHQRCALCSEIVEQGYVRDSQTRLIYCDAQCLAGGSHTTMPLLNGRARKVS